MIYLDTSVALAHLLAEDRHPPDSFWARPMVSSRLLQVECWVRLNARGLGVSHGEALRSLLGRVAFIELSPQVLARALEPFPGALRTLDALHLASAELLRALGQQVTMASYDDRLLTAAVAMGIPAEPL